MFASPDGSAMPPQEADPDAEGNAGSVSPSVKADTVASTPRFGFAMERAKASLKSDGTSSAHRSASRLQWARSASQMRRVTLGIFTTPCQLFRFLARLSRTFPGFVSMVILSGGLNVGVAKPMGDMARRVYFSDVLQIDGATAGRFSAAAMVPWCIKPIFGMLSDAVPIFGYHRTSYVIIAGFCGVIAWVSLGLLPLAGAAVVPFLALAQVSAAMSDVMVDGRQAELIKSAPGNSADLPALAMGALGAGGLVACSSSGLLLDTLGPRTVFLLLSVCSVGIILPGLRNWWGEKRVAGGLRKPDTAWVAKNRAVALLVAYISITAVTLSILQITVESKAARGICTGVFAVILTVCIFAALKPISPVLAKTAIFIFAREALQPATGEAMFQWLKNCPDGPRFSPTVLSWVDCFGALSLLAGAVIYNKFLAEVPYRKIFFCTQLGVAIFGLFDYVLVRRWNVLVGIPDILLLIGEDAMKFTMARLFLLPMVVLAAKVCPESVEVTLFAMLMALIHMGHTISDLLGVSLLEAYGVVDGNFDNLADAVLAKSLTKILPILLIPVLVPNLKPTDPIVLGRNPEASEDAHGAEPNRLPSGAAV